MNARMLFWLPIEYCKPNMKYLEVCMCIQEINMLFTQISQAMHTEGFDNEYRHYAFTEHCCHPEVRRLLAQKGFTVVDERFFNERKLNASDLLVVIHPRSFANQCIDRQLIRKNTIVWIVDSRTNSNAVQHADRFFPAPERWSIQNRTCGILFDAENWTVLNGQGVETALEDVGLIVSTVFKYLGAMGYTPIQPYCLAGLRSTCPQAKRFALAFQKYGTEIVQAISGASAESVLVEDVQHNTIWSADNAPSLVVLMSGDADTEPIITALQEKKTQVMVIAWRDCTSLKFKYNHSVLFVSLERILKRYNIAHKMRVSKARN